MSENPYITVRFQLCYELTPEKRQELITSIKTDYALVIRDAREVEGSP